MSHLKQVYQRFIQFDPAADQLRHVAVLHQVIGLNHKSTLAVKIWKLSFALVFAQALCFVYRLYQVWVQDMGFSYVICALDVVLGYVSGAIRTAGVVYYSGELYQLKMYLLEESSFRSNDPEALRIRQEHYVNNQKFTLFMLCAGFGGVFIWSMTDYRMTDHYKIPFELDLLGPTFKSIFDTLYGLYMLLLSAYCWIPFITIRVLLRILCAELLIINRAFAELFNTATNDTDAVMRHVSCSSQQANQIRSRIFWKCLRSELRTVLAHHRELLVNVERLQLLSSAPFLGEMFSGVMVVSFAIFLLMLLKGASLVLTMVSCIAILESYYNSALVEELQDVHADTGRVMYDLDWPTVMRYDRENAKEYKNFHQIMTFVVVRSQHRLRFKCGGMFEMSMETFTFTMKACYKFFMFVLQVYDI